MTFNEFRMGHADLYSAKHRTKAIYIGCEIIIPSIWWIFVDGEADSLDRAATLKQAKQMAHVQFDKGDPCPIELKWQFVEGTKGNFPNRCQVCGNPVTHDLGDSLHCPDCGWKHIYTVHERELLPKFE